MCPLLLLQTLTAYIFQKHLHTVSHLRNQYTKCSPPLKLQTHHLHTDTAPELIRSVLHQNVMFLLFLKKKKKGKILNKIMNQNRKINNDGVM